jgi:3',5'-cyclic AMP phosphodiesterase CpdA
MKIALITDTHWGVRNDHSAFLDNNKKFLDDIFFPYLDNHRINTVIHLGDLVDRRKYLNINTAKRLRTDFLDRIASEPIDFHILVGNHDTYFKNTNSVNVLQELLVDKYPDFKIYDEYAKIVEFDGTKIMINYNIFLSINFDGLATTICKLCLIINWYWQLVAIYLDQE